MVLFWRVEQVGRGLNGLGDVAPVVSSSLFSEVSKKRFHFNLLKSLFKFFVCSF